MFGIGGFELFIILIFGFLIFGPDKLPEIAKTIGKGIARFREAQREMNEVLGDEPLIDLNNPDQPIKDPMETLDRIAQLQEEKRSGASKGAAAKAADAEETTDEPKQESFTERKARYERERAERKAAEAEAKAAAKAEAEAAAAAEAQAEAEAKAEAAIEAVTETVEVTEEAAPAEATDAVSESPAEGGDA